MTTLLLINPTGTRQQSLQGVWASLFPRLTAALSHTEILHQVCTVQVSEQHPHHHNNKRCCFSLTREGAQAASHEAQRLPELRIMLLGKRWTGKCVAGNIILGRETFQTKITTGECVKKQGEVAGRQVTVVNTPDWREHDSVQETPEQVKQEIVCSVTLCPPGPHALLLVIPVGSVSERERRAAQEHLELLSERVWRHTIVLFTWGERLGDTTIEQHIERGGQELQWLVEKCGNRYHVLNYRNRGDGTQVTELLDKIEEMVAENRGDMRETGEGETEEEKIMGVMPMIYKPGRKPKYLLGGGTALLPLHS
ncbi:GTPase IMAP family member 2 [Amia ocellicauda]|uniref:GTPase IMAP family member 2 n=1 Tax=Amia ocellicauda TaxID=2972642 RepID=UPI003464B0B8